MVVYHGILVGGPKFKNFVYALHPILKFKRFHTLDPVI